MELMNVRSGAVLEVAVLLFQVLGVAGLFLTRLMTGTRWAERGRVGFIFALVGLGIAGALCGSQDSAFALFAGGTMTVLLIGMTCGNSATDRAPRAALTLAIEPNLAA